MKLSLTWKAVMGMSKIEELIKKKCPNGVDYKSLGELGDFFGGLTGKSKDDFFDGNAVFITYKNVYLNPSLDIEPLDRVKILEGENQRTLEYGDVVFTASSETQNECGIASVVTKCPVEKLYLNSFCFILRFSDLSIIEPNFAKHLFRSHELRYQISKTALGVTRFNVSKDKMKKVIIPVPPIEVQQEIAHILDKFTELEAELQAELDARKKQYEHYRRELLTFSDDIPIVKLGDICDVITGGEPPTNAVKGDKPAGEMVYPIWGNGKAIYGYTDSYRVNRDSVCISSIGANTGAIFYHEARFTPIIRLKVLVPKIESVISKYLYYALCVYRFETKQSTVPNMNANEVKNKEVPLPSLDVQKHIIDRLDKFEEIISDTQSGLSAEIDARHKQYEYYRDKLLSFKRVGEEV